MKKKLKEVCTGYTKNISQKELENIDGEYEIFGASGLIKKINYYVSEKSYIGIVKDGSGVGRVNSYPPKSSLIGTMQYIVPNEDIDLQYLMYGLRYLNLGNLYKGAAIPHIYFKEYKELDLNIPSLPEQKKIASYLDKIQSAIDSKKQELAALDELVKSKFVEMFGEIDLSLEKDEWTALKDVTKIYTGTTPSTSNLENWGGEIPWITPAEMKSDTFFVNKTERMITEEGRASKSLELMPVGTVLLSTRAPIGKVGIVNIPMTCNQGFKNFYCNKDELNSIYLYILLKNNTEYLNSKGTGTTFLELSKSNAEKIKIPVPPLSLQTAFATFVQKTDQAKNVVKNQLALLNELLETKMAGYFG